MRSGCYGAGLPARVATEAKRSATAATCVAGCIRASACYHTYRMLIRVWCLACCRAPALARLLVCRVKFAVKGFRCSSSTKIPHCSRSHRSVVASSTIRPATDVVVHVSRMSYQRLAVAIASGGRSRVMTSTCLLASSASCTDQLWAPCMARIAQHHPGKLLFKRLHVC